MIARTWRGVTLEADGERYRKYLQQTGVAECMSTPGNRGVYVLKRSAGEGAEFLFVSLWDSMDSVRDFAGPEPERGRFFPEDDQYLIERDEVVYHYEVWVAPSAWEAAEKPQRVALRTPQPRIPGGATKA